METFRVELTSRRISLAEAMIQRGIFQGDALSTLLLVIAMMLLNHILRKCTGSYKLSNSQEKINHLIYMDDIKLCKKRKKLETLIQAVRIYSQDIRMEFSIKKCAFLVMTNEKRHMMEGIELSNQEKIRTLREKETLRILESHIIKQVKIKEKIQKAIYPEKEETTRKQIN